MSSTHSDNAKNNYFGLEPKDASPENSKVVIIPVPYEATTSYGQGTKLGPQAILDASQQVELFDDELWVEPCKVGIYTHEPVKIKPVIQKCSMPFQELFDVVNPIVEFGKFPIILGGEHSLSLGSVRACIEKYPDLSILQIDAHADLRQSYEDIYYSHACIAYHLYDTLPKPHITQVGIRNISFDEAQWLESAKPNIKTYWARNQHKWNTHEMLEGLSKNVYLTIDIDGLDSSIMPCTGTPEPGGMLWYQLMDILKLLFAHKNVIAADIVEFAPLPKFHAPDFLVAKLLYKIIGYKFASILDVKRRY